jgi:LAS superfamily LD-carboxypeptidase LdcB
MINMSRSKKKKDPIRTLIRGMIFLAVAAAVCFAVFYGLNAFEKHALDQKKKDTEAINQKREQEYNAALAEYQSATQKGQNLNWPQAKPEGWDVIDISAFPLENTRCETLDRASLLIGGMLLVNPWHPLPADFPTEGVAGVYNNSGKKVKASNADVKLFQPAIDALKLAMQDAATAGIKELFVDKGFRTNEEQKAFFESKKTALEDKYSGDTLIEMTKKEVNEPGTSEYQSGFSFTMGIYPNPNKLYFQDSDQGKWFIDNCWKYGFIFRFPSRDYPNSSWMDKSFKTGVTARLNLYRWVGVPHATVMKQLDLCMEEYVEYLIQHPHLIVYENGTPKYEIYRKQVGEEATVNIDVPMAASYTLASLDNMGGIVLAFIY